MGDQKETHKEDEKLTLILGLKYNLGNGAIMMTDSMYTNADGLLTKQKHIFVDVGNKRVLLVDSECNKVIFARTSRKERRFMEYSALSLGLRYIRSVYTYKDILLITDAESQSQVLNGKSGHTKTHKWKTYSDDLKRIIDEIRWTNILNIIWVPRRFNHAGIIETGFKKERLTLFAQTNFEEVNFDTLEPVKKGIF